MCLFSKKRTSANKDLVCYKIIERYENFYGECCYKTPFQGTPVSIKVIEGQEFRPDPFPSISVERKSNSNYEVYGGFIHSYKTRWKARKMAKYMRETIFKDEKRWYEIYKCIIPKGTEYFDGVEVNGFGAYASKSIKIIKKTCA